MKYLTPHAIVSLLATTPAVPSRAARIIPVTGSAGETNVNIEAMSADGSTHLVQASDNTFGRWTQSGGFTPLPFTPPTTHRVFFPRAISDDGQAVAGTVTINGGIWVFGRQ